MNISIRAVRYFVAAGETGSITKAAEQMNISHSAIAAAIDTIEAEFGVQLMQRFRAKGLKLTPIGRSIHTRAQHLLEEYGQFLNDSAEMGDALQGRLQVGYFAPLAPAFMPKLIQPIMEAGNDIYFQLTECSHNDEAQQGLRDGKFDLAIFMDYIIHPDIRHRELLEIPPYLLVQRGHRLADRESVKFSDIADESFVLLDLPSTLEYYRTMLSVVGRRPKVVAGVNRTEMVRSMVAAGQGCSILNMRPRTSRTYFGDDVVCIPFNEDRARSRYLVLGCMSENPRRLVREFENQCVRYFNSEEAKDLCVPLP